MADNSRIEWTDATWNPVTGCSVLSPGCTNCYAMQLAGTRLRHHPSRAGLTIDTKAGPVWNGKVRLNEQWLAQPFAWRKPRMIFVCAHGDLFHEDVPDEWIDQVFAIMALAPRHTFQVLTKRAERMRKYVDDAVGRVIARADGDWPGWPLPNIWLGVSAERQQEADQRIPELLATPAAVRFISAEPLLGPIDLRAISTAGIGSAAGNKLSDVLHWAIVGGESGQGARPMHPAWARSLRDQCHSAGIPFFFKQWGEYWPAEISRRGEEGEIWRTQPTGKDVWFFDERHAADPPTIRHHRIGKGKAGRLLDGVEHNGMPRPRGERKAA